MAVMDQAAWMDAVGARTRRERRRDDVQIAHGVVLHMRVDDDGVPDEVRVLAERWLDRVETIATEMYETLAERISIVQTDPELASRTLASCTSNIETILSMLRDGVSASTAEAPVMALEHARFMAARGAEVDDTLRFYRLGQGYFMRRVTEELPEMFADPDRALAAITQATAYTVEYIDIVSGRVSTEHLAERERRQRRASVIQADLVASLIARDPADLTAAGRRLGHDLDRAQLCVICWSPRPSAQLERAATAVAAALGSSHPLLVPDGADAIVAWLTPSAGSRPFADAAAKALGANAPDVSASLGAVGVGLAGFRSSRDEAGRARRVAEMLGREAPRCVAYEDVALLDLLTQDLAAARRFVHQQLGELAAADGATAAVRDTARTVLAPRGGIALAARLQSVHRNTVLQRIRRAEALRGRPLEDQADECYLALLLALALPDVLRE